jgi:hypothetical protein
MAHDVFISYAAEDGKVAEVIRRSLEDEGIKCWIAPRDVPIGTNYEDAIIDAICISRVMILIISEHSNKSPHVKREIQNACLEDSPTQILPLRVDAVPLNKALRYYLSSLQWLDASKRPIEEHLQELVSNVRARLAAEEKGEIESENVRAAIEKFEGESKPVTLMKEETRPADVTKTDRGGSLFQQKKLLLAIAAGIMMLAAVGIFWAYKSRSQNQPATNSLVPANHSTPPNVNQGGGNGDAASKLYKDMATPEKLQFIEERAQQILARLGDTERPLDFDDDDLVEIKSWVDSYFEHVGNNSRERGRTDTRFIFRQARQLAPFIIRTFEDRAVPPIIGLYLPVIESEYKNLCTPKDQAKGIFQLSLTTAHNYGLKEEDYCSVNKSIQAAAFYMSDLIKKWGRDSNNVTLAIFSFNRDPALVQRDLSKVADTPEKQRSFWTLLAEQHRLDREVREELDYIPRFFAAAIVGENPRVFGLRLRPISTYTKESDAKDADESAEQD